MNYRKRKKHGEKFKYQGKYDHIHYPWNACCLEHIYGFFDNPDLKAEIIICANEGGNEPHFHVVCDDVNFHAAILINEANYYNHVHNQSILTDKQKRLLINALNSHQSWNKKVTIWEIIVQSWDWDVYSYKTVNDKMPDYTMLGTKIKDFPKLRKRPADWPTDRDIYYVHPGWVRTKKKRKWVRE